MAASTTSSAVRRRTARVNSALGPSDDATLTEVPGDHFTVVDPTDRSWSVVLDRITGLVERAE